MTPRIGLALLYNDRLEAALGARLRADSEALLTEAAALLGPVAAVEIGGLVGSEEGARRLAARWADLALDALVLLPAVASPPSIGSILTASSPPILIWDALRIDSVPPAFGYDDVVRHAGSVGATMLGNVLRRQGRSFQVVVGALRDPVAGSRIGAWLGRASAARRMRSARVGRLGSEMAGYLDVLVEPSEIGRRLGLEVVDVPEAELESAHRAVALPRIEAEIAAMRAAWHVDLDAADAARSARLALALEDLFRDRRLDAAALNCHSRLLRDNPEIGLVACYGASRLTGMGLPVACTGDLTVAVAKLATTALGAEAHWCEAVALDLREDWLLLTNTGEGDPRLARADAPRRIEAHGRFPGACGCGAKVVFACRAGVSTLVAFTPQPGAPGGHTFVVARGEVLDAAFPATGVAAAAFRFSGRGCTEGFELWCSAGAPHHAVLAAGDLTEPLRQLGALWGTGVAVL